MIIDKYLIQFNCPAFLGNADQSGQFRSPPFKALLRHYWRMAYSASHQHGASTSHMRIEESKLFGSVSVGGHKGGKKSELRLRLNHWQIGDMQSIEMRQRVRHPEVGKGGAEVSSALYLGYGPLTYDGASRRTSMKIAKAISPQQSVELALAYPEECAHLMQNALVLANLLGSIGSRSRNGWGSFRIARLDDTSNNENLPLEVYESSLFRDWQACLSTDWPHAIGEDLTGPLIWRSGPLGSWEQAMGLLAEAKVGLRTQFPLDQDIRNGEHTKPQQRHVLAFPVTNHDRVRGWNKNFRLPNSLRFKVAIDEAKSVVAQIAHLPCRPPDQFRNLDNAMLESTWSKVHKFLDTDSGFTRFRPELQER